MEEGERGWNGIGMGCGLSVGMQYVNFPPVLHPQSSHTLFLSASFVFGVCLCLRLMANVEDSIAMDMWCALCIQSVLVLLSMKCVFFNAVLFRRHLEDLLIILLVLIIFIVSDSLCFQ